MKPRKHAAIRYLRALLRRRRDMRHVLFSFSFLSFRTSKAALFCRARRAAHASTMPVTLYLWLLVTLASIIHLGVVPACASDAVAQTVRWALLLLAPAVWFDLLQEVAADGLAHQSQRRISCRYSGTGTVR
jgi:hypothetical protein